MPPTNDSAPIKISFEIEGVQALRATFDSLEQRMARFDSQTTARAKAGSQERGRATRREVSDREREYRKLVTQTERWEKQTVKDAEKAAKEKEKIANQEAKWRERVRENSQRMAHRMLLQEVRDEEKASREKLRIVEQEEKRAAELRKQFRTRVTGAAVSGAGAGFSSFTNRITGLAAGALTLGGGFAIANAMHTEMGFQRAVAQASNMAFIPGMTTRAQASPERITRLAESVQATTNISKTEAANALKTYVGLSSDLEGIAAVDKKTGRSNLEEMAIMAKASGTDFNDLIRAAAALKANNPGATPETLLTQMRGVLGSGKQGTLPLEQIASQIGLIQATAGSYSGSMTAAGMATNQNRLLGLAQITGRATGGDAAMAATSVRHLAADLTHAVTKGKISAAEVFEGGDAKKGLLAPSQLLANVFKKTQGRDDLVLDLLTERGGKASFNALKPVFLAAEAKQKGSGVEAVRNLVEGASAPYSQSDVMKEFNTVMKTDGERLDASFKRINEVIERKATPFLERFATSLESHEKDITTFLDALGNLAEFASQHPWLALGSVMLAEVSKSVAEASIGAALRAALENSAKSGMTAATPAMASIIATAAATAIALGIAAIDKAEGEEAKRQDRVAGTVGAAGGVAARLRAGTATPEDIKKAQEIRGQLQGALAADESNIHPFGSVKGFFNNLGSAVGVGASEDAIKQSQREWMDHKKMLDEVNTALATFAERMRAVPTPQGGGNSPTTSTSAPNRSQSLAEPARGGQGK